jgi:arylsulfatase A-like enzyme
VNGENVIVVGGHGEGLGEHGEATHTRLIYESVMHVPLIVSCPKLFKGAYRVEDAVVTNADIVPTVLDLLGLPAAPDLDGVSMVHCREDRNRAVYLESVAPYVEEGWSPLFGLRRHADKYILAPRPEYYELATDPRESKNLFTEVGGAALEARQQLVTDLGGGSRIGPRSRGSPRRSSRWTRRHARSSPRSATSGRRPRRPRRRPSPIPRT